MAKNDKSKEIPLEGSLGLLASGAQGLRAWRKRKSQWKMEQKGE